MFRDKWEGNCSRLITDKHQSTAVGYPSTTKSDKVCVWGGGIIMMRTRAVSIIKIKKVLGSVNLKYYQRMRTCRQLPAKRCGLTTNCCQLTVNRCRQPDFGTHRTEKGTKRGEPRRGSTRTVVLATPHIISLDDSQFEKFSQLSLV